MGTSTQASWALYGTSIAIPRGVCRAQQQNGCLKCCKATRIKTADSAVCRTACLCEHFGTDCVLMKTFSTATDRMTEARAIAVWQCLGSDCNSSGGRTGEGPSYTGKSLCCEVCPTASPSCQGAAAARWLLDRTCWVARRACHNRVMWPPTTCCGCSGAL
jgi:hypothetical protein